MQRVFKLSHFIQVSVSPDCILYTTCVQNPQKPEERTRPSETVVTDVVNHPVCWESHRGPMEGLPVLLRAILTDDTLWALGPTGCMRGLCSEG